jgi:hypothetical protein
MGIGLARNAYRGVMTEQERIDRETLLKRAAAIAGCLCQSRAHVVRIGGCRCVRRPELPAWEEGQQEV